MKNLNTLCKLIPSYLQPSFDSCSFSLKVKSLETGQTLSIGLRESLESNASGIYCLIGCLKDELNLFGNSLAKRRLFSPSCSEYWDYTELRGRLNEVQLLNYKTEDYLDLIFEGFSFLSNYRRQETKETNKLFTKRV